jgi:hypothetical protein
MNLATEAEYSAAGEATGDYYTKMYGGDLQNLSVYDRFLAQE